MQTAINDVARLLGQDFERCESSSLRLEKFVNITKGNKTERAVELKKVVECHSRFAKRPVLYSLDFPGQRKVYACLKGNLIVNQSGGVLENAGFVWITIEAFHISLAAQ